MNLSTYDYGLLFIFKTCAEAASFSRASEILQVRQPAISYSIKKLEDLLEIKLFERGNYGIRLTEEGKILYEYILEASNNIVSGLNIVDEVSKSIISEIKVGTSLNISLEYLAATLREFNELFPNVIVSLYSRDENTMLQNLQDKKLDIAIFNSSKNHAIKGIKVRKIKNNEIVCVGVKKFKDMIESKNTEELTIPLISPSSTTNLGKALDEKIGLTGITLKKNIYCQSAIIAKHLILSGLGIGCISREIISKELETGQLYILKADKGVDVYSIDIATQDRNLNIAVEQFIKIYRDKVNE